MKFGGFSQDHNGAAEGTSVVDDRLAITEYIFQHIHIYPNRVVLEQSLQGLEPGAWKFVFFEGDPLRLEVF